MALYSFLCVDPQCANEFDKNVPMADRNEVQDCPVCGGPAERQLSLDVGVVWKTTGGTRTFDSKRMPKVPDINSGHNDLTLGKLGLTEPGDAAALGL